MEKLWIPKASESKEVEVESKSDAHSVLRYSRHRSFRILTPRPNSEPNSSAPREISARQEAEPLESSRMDAPSR